MYQTGQVEVNYRGELYKTDYLDWYKQAVERGGHGTPTWVIDINGELMSDIKHNSNFYPVYAATMTFTSEFLFSHKSVASKSLSQLDPLNMSRSENVVMRPILVIIPHGACFATLSDYQRRQVSVPIRIKKFMNSEAILIDHSRYHFDGAILNHVELINGDEIALIFTSYNIRIKEKIYNNDGKRVGNIVKNLNYAPMSSLLDKGIEEGVSVAEDVAS